MYITMKKIIYVCLTIGMLLLSRYMVVAQKTTVTGGKKSEIGNGYWTCDCPMLSGANCGCVTKEE
jgi:hypothetical protein